MTRYISALSRSIRPLRSLFDEEALPKDGVRFHCRLCPFKLVAPPSRDLWPLRHSDLHRLHAHLRFHAPE